MIVRKVWPLKCAKNGTIHQHQRNSTEESQENSPHENRTHRDLQIQIFFFFQPCIAYLRCARQSGQGPIESDECQDGRPPDLSHRATRATRASRATTELSHRVTDKLSHGATQD